MFVVFACGFLCVFFFVRLFLCVSLRLLPFRSDATWQLRPTKESRSAAAFLLAMESEKMTDFLLRFRDVTGGLKDGLRESPFAASLHEPRVDFFWRAKSVRPIQTILGTAEQIRREVMPIGLGFADGLEQLPPLCVDVFCAVG